MNDVMSALAWYEVVGRNVGSVTIPYDELQAIVTLIEKLKYTIIAIKQQMIGDLEAIWCEGHGFIEYDDLKQWKEQYIKDE